MIGKYKTYEKYEEALRTRLKSLVTLFNKHQEDYPFSVQIYGFKPLCVNSEKEMIAKIIELCDCLHEPYPIITEETNNAKIEYKLL